MSLDAFLAAPSDLLEIAVRVAVVYVALVGIVRLTGKRTLAKFNAFDFLVTVALGSMVSMVILDTGLSVAEGLLGIALLIGAQYLVTTGVTRWRWMQRVVKSDPRLLFYDGAFLRDNLQRERIATEEVLSSVREQGYPRLDEVHLVILETDGSMSVIGREAARPLPSAARPYDTLTNVVQGAHAELAAGERLPPVEQWETPRRGKRPDAPSAQ